MLNADTEHELAALLAKYDTSGGVIDYVFLPLQDEGSSEHSHRAAALAGIVELDRRLEQWAICHASKQHPIEMFFRLCWDDAKLTGKRVSFPEFWGNDDVEQRAIGNRTGSIPNVDGYKTAFFHPPYGLQGTECEKEELFANINRHVLGDNAEHAEIFSWSTDWSNYFEAGHEWWGAFYWTIHPSSSQYFVVVGVSSTD